ncbi:MAG: MgtC/SapB family protein [Allosphingosinicella sp.]
MDWMDGAWAPLTTGWPEALLRFAASIVLPLLIGVERYLRKKPIDFRPFVIISVAACGLAFAGLELAERASDPQLRIDPTRIFAGVITGISFLGAGAMFRRDGHVQGAGSAAAVWAAGTVGLLCGCGFLWLAGIVSVAVLVLLAASRPFTADYDAEE